jgi:ADP-heptose:LPS heptosyltransferase
MSERFLISRLSSLGDVACSLPAAAALKSGFPDCSIVWVVDPRFADLVRCCDAVDEVVLAKPGLRPSTWPRFEGEFTAAIDLQGLLKSAIPVWRSKTGAKVGYHWQREGAWLFSDPVLPDPSSAHVVDQYVDVARALGGVADRADFRLAPKGESLDRVRLILAQSGVEDRFVVLNAGAGWATKRWPPESFATVVDELHELGIACVLIGGKASSDRAAADAVIADCREKPADLLGRTSVGDLVALLSLSAAHLGGDTGSTHIAAALGKPAVGLYSITRPQRCCPYGQFSRSHYDPESLSRISPEAVIVSLKEALA